MRNLRTTYLIALSIIALVIAFSQYLVQSSIQNSGADARTINISGRQRMLSQKITKASLAMANAQNQENFDKRKKELKSAVEIWRRSHDGLQNGSMALKLTEVNNSEQILELFEKIQPHYEEIDDAVTNIMGVSEFYNAKTLSYQANLEKILNNEGDFLKFMNDITFQYDSEASARVEQLSSTEYILFAVAILLLVMEGLFIFRPAINKINEYTKKLIQQGKSLETSLRNVEYLNNQAKSVFANVKQGIFLLDKELMISDFYSAETENIFENKDLAGMNFIRLMSSRLVKRDLNALEMFAEHLFNSDIKEDVVNRLNPVEQVELFSSQGSVDFQVRYIRISFSRIMDQDKIHRILVTVLDETEYVLMKKQIEEADERNRQESDQLLALLKVNPKLLKDYIDSSLVSLESISENYEKFQGGDFGELIRYTFNTVHAAKGNATLIDLKIIEDKLHSIEDTIVMLKGKSNIQGKDFLKILYEVTDVISILRNMKDMLRKVADVYKMNAEEISDNTNDLLVASLKKGVNKMSSETGKQVHFVFEDNNIVLPEQYRLDIRDAVVQLVRNSLAHGIESSDIRQSKGKPPHGTLKVTINKSDMGLLTLTYQDDGQGLDLERIKMKALQSNLISNDEVEKLNSSQIAQLVFEDSLSTSDDVNMYSGRGQGLSLVKSIAEKNKGEVKLGIEQEQFKLDIVIP